MWNVDCGMETEDRGRGCTRRADARIHTHPHRGPIESGVLQNFRRQKPHARETMRTSIFAEDVCNESISVPIPEPLSSIIVDRLRDSSFSQHVALGEAPCVVAHGPLYRIVSVEDFHKLPARTQSSAVAIRAKDEMAVVMSGLCEQNATLKVGNVSVDLKSGTRLVVTKDKKYTSPLGCIELDTHDQVCECFRRPIDPAAVRPVAIPLKEPSFFQGSGGNSGNGGNGGCYIPTRFANLVAVYCEQVLRLHVLFSAEAGKPRRLFVDSVAVVDLESPRRSLITCKFHAASGRCFCKTHQSNICHRAVGLTMTMQLCGGEVGPSGHCRACGRESEHARCLAGFTAPMVSCKHQKECGARVVGSKIPIHNSSFLQLFAIGCVDIRHGNDPKSTLLWYDRLEAALDTSVQRFLAEHEKTASDFLLQDQWVAEMLCDGSFAFDVKRNSLTRVGGKIKIWQKLGAAGHLHLFRRKK